MDKEVNSSRTPIYRDAGFCFNDIDQALKARQEEIAYPQSSSDYIYSRYGNPTIIETEKKLASLEESKWAILSSSGMSAIDIALSIFQEKGKKRVWIFFSELYGGTNEYIDEVLIKRRGIKVQRFYPDGGNESYNVSRLENLLDDVKPELIYFEPITNPLLIVIDGIQVIKAARNRGIRVIVDNTFATPYLWHPLSDGADIVVHSATKYLSGHGNVTAGVMCGNDPEVRRQALLYRRLVGSILSPDDAYRLGTQVMSFNLRIQKQCENAHKLARELNAHNAASKVRYPNLESHPTHDQAVRVFANKNYGAMITLEIKGGRKACDRFIENVAYKIQYIPTLGNVETVLLHVSSTFGEDKYPHPGMIRLSVGIEPYDQLKECILSALELLKSP